MNINDIAKEAGILPIEYPEGMEPMWWSVDSESIIKFAALIAKAERERCARVCEEMPQMPTLRHGGDATCGESAAYDGGCQNSAAAIREPDDQ